ncbi:hypothetical protein PsorP6_008977 [Peronosclerospora sorghi]|uniref:Uncharacterized protein n=1 Tax=Peronosclerospora sorghi TaxID=230839 RepID=A0ACC0W0G5_9STRA|nr:hypothetical protein PsorP6_008977 [Peronosclerospora sorghi]
MTMAQKSMRRHVSRWSSKRPRVAVRSRSTYTSVMMIHSASIWASVKMRLGRELAELERAGLVGQGGRRRRAGRTWGHKQGDVRTGRGGGEPELRSTAGVVSTCKTRYRRQKPTCSSTTKSTIWNKSQRGSPLSFTHARGAVVLLTWIVPNEIT